MTLCKLCNLPIEDQSVRCTCFIGGRERTLPIWAQQELHEARHRLMLETDRRRRLQEAHAVLNDRNWFTLTGPQDGEPPRHLYWDICNPACSLGPRDVLLIGRYNRESREK